MRGQPIGSVKSYHDTRQWLPSLGYFHPTKLQGDLLAQRITGYGGINTSAALWGETRSTAFLLPPFLFCLTT